MKLHFRSFLLFMLFSVFAVSSCEKEKLEENNDSKTDVLTSEVWVYNEVYNNWGLSNQVLVYRRDPPVNSATWGNTRVKYYKDGTFEEFRTTGQYVTGTWQFLNNETQIKITSGANNNIVEIVTLTENNFDWNDLTSKAYGKMVPKK